MPPFPTKRMLGIDFFVGTAAEAIAHISKYGGLIVAPAAPSFIALQDDPDYRRAIADADFLPLLIIKYGTRIPAIADELKII
jgi:hypothetical protein